MPRFLAAIAFFLFLQAPVLAVEPDEILSDPALEARARAISGELRCLVCQNQSIDDSNAPLAKDLRVLVRERLKAGASDREVIDFVVERYSEFVLLKPRFGPRTLVLWLATPLLLILSAAALYFAYRRRQSVSVSAPAQALSTEEQRKVKKLLDRA